MRLEGRKGDQTFALILGSIRDARLHGALEGPLLLKTVGFERFPVDAQHNYHLSRVFIVLAFSLRLKISRSVNRDVGILWKESKASKRSSFLEKFA